VVLQARDEQRQSVGDLDNIYVRSDKNGRLVPLASVVEIQEGGAASELRRFNRMRAVTITGDLAGGYPLGDALDYLERTVREQQGEVPVQIDYDGESRELKQSSGGLFLTFAFALVIVYLVLAAQFESFRDPFIVLAGSVPLAISGALLFSFVGLTTLNIYSQIGLITLVGLVAKNGILIVEFANSRQESGDSKLEAVIEASSTRLRPILMTTAATVMGHFPLILATGPGAGARNSIGLMLVTGMIIGTAFTLFVVPSIYVLVAKTRQAEGTETVPGALPNVETTAPDEMLA
jgi:multidrug efflux pump